MANAVAQGGTPQRGRWGGQFHLGLTRDSKGAFVRHGEMEAFVKETANKLEVKIRGEVRAALQESRVGQQDRLEIPQRAPPSGTNRARLVSLHEMEDHVRGSVSDAEARLWFAMNEALARLSNAEVKIGHLALLVWEFGTVVYDWFKKHAKDHAEYLLKKVVNHDVMLRLLGRHPAQQPGSTDQGRGSQTSQKRKAA